MVLTATLVGAALLLAAGQGTAHAALVTVTPSIQGAGSVSTSSGYSCTNSVLSNTFIVACGATSHDTGFFGGTATVTLHATPRSGGGWFFAGWDGCPSGNGSSTCVMTAGTFATTTFTPRAHFRDFSGPTVTSITPVYSTSTDRGVSFNVTADDLVSAYECSVDSGPLQPCGTLRELAEGSHSVRARGIDFVGNVGALSSPTPFKVVDTQLVSGPADFSNAKRPTFTYSTVQGLTFECSIDSTAVTTPCGTKGPDGRASFTPPADLADGAHTFRVRARDGSDFDRVPVVRTWTVDSTPPDTTLAAPDLPEGVLTTLTNATFTYASTEPTGAAFQCKLDTAAFSACTSPSAFSNLPFGGHTFQVRAIDRAGNVDPSPATRNWEIAARDNDGDGFTERSDCNDGDPRINPGAADTAGNGVDENCDGADSTSPAAGPTAPAPIAGPAGTASSTSVIPALLSAKGTARGTRIVFTKLSATRVPVGATITTSCSSKKRGACPFKTKRTAAKRATVNLIAALAKRQRGKPGKKLTFGAPAVVTVTVTKPGMTARAFRFTLVKGKFPKSRLL